MLQCQNGITTHGTLALVVVSVSEAPPQPRAPEDVEGGGRAGEEGAPHPVVVLANRALRTRHVARIEECKEPTLACSNTYRV